MCPYPFDFECSSERLLRRDRELRKRGTKNPVTPIPVNSGQPLFGPPFAYVRRGGINRRLLQSSPWRRLQGSNHREIRSCFHSYRHRCHTEDSTMFTKVMMGIALALTAIPALPVTAAQAQYAVCLPARGCIPTTQKSYNACYELARERGW